MKRFFKVICMGMMALAVAGVHLNLQAQESEGSATKEQAAKKERSYPFNGTLKEIDKEAGTVKVGNRIFQLTPKTKYLQDSLDEAKIGEKVGGAYWKKDDGTLEVRSIRFGPKPKKEKQEKKDKDADGK